MEKQDVIKEYTKNYQDKLEYKRKRSENHKNHMKLTRIEENKPLCCNPDYKSGIRIEEMLILANCHTTADEVVTPVQHLVTTTTSSIG
jgi:hypothetical protein